MKLNLFIKIFIICISFFLTNLYAENKYLKEGINYFKIKDFEKAKFKFEQDIVRNPKSESAYLYLADIFKEEKKKKLQEQNLKTVILLNPTNEIAVYNLALLNLDKSNYSETKKLLQTFKKVCKTTCSKSSEIQNKLKKSQNK